MSEFIRPWPLLFSFILYILLLGLVPEALELSLELSQTVTDRLDALIDAVVAELRLLGYRLYSKQQ